MPNNSIQETSTDMGARRMKTWKAPKAEMLM